MGLPFGGTGPIRSKAEFHISVPDQDVEVTPSAAEAFAHFYRDLAASGLTLNPPQQTEIRHLSQETDSEIFLEDLFRLALSQRFASDRRLTYFICTWLERWGERYLPEAPGEFLGKVRRERDLLENEGGLGSVLEPMVRDFARQAMDPVMIGSMMVAFPVSRWFQFKTLQNLSRLPVASIWSREVPAYLGAKSIGFAAEVSTFVAASKGIQVLLGDKPDCSIDALWADTQRMALVLLFLKAGNGLGSGAWKFSHGPHVPPDPRFLFMTQWLGVFVGHEVLGKLELAPLTSPRQNLLESLAFLLQMEVGATLGQSFLKNIPIKLSGPPPFRFFSNLLGVGNGISPRWIGVSPEGFPTPLLMDGVSPEGGVASLTHRRLVQSIAEKFNSNPADPRVAVIAAEMSRTEFQLYPEEQWNLYRDLVLRTSLEGRPLPDGSQGEPLDLLQRGTEVFRHVFIQEPFRRGTGSFYDSMIQVALERTLETKKPAIFADLLEVVARQRSIGALEKFFTRWGLHYRYQLRENILTLALKSPHWRRRLKSLGLPHSVHATLASYLATYSQGGDAAPFRDPDYNFLILSEPRDLQRKVPMKGDYALEYLEQRLADPQYRQAYSEILSWVVERAGGSPVPLLYFDRLFKILATGGLKEKVVEIASPDLFHWASLYRWVSTDSLPDYQGAAQQLDGTLYTGYVKDVSLARKFAQFYHSVPLLTHPNRANIHRNEFHLFATKTLGTGTDFGPREVLELLYHRPTPLARHARETLLKGDVDFEILSQDKMAVLAKKYQPNLEGEVPEGIFLPAERSPSGKPYIAVLEINPNFSRERKIAHSLYLAAITVHEFEHYLHHENLGPFSQGNQMRSEMRAWLEEQFYLLQQGEIGEWRRSRELSPEGFGVYLRKLIDLSYLNGPKDLVIR